MRIGIELNGVLRDTIEKFKQTYEKYLIDEEFDEKLKTYEALDDREEYKEILSKHELPFKYEILTEVDSMNLSNHFAFPNNDELYNFMYQEFPMQIFGHAPSSEMNTFNVLNDLYVKHRDKIEFTIISDEISKSKPATLFFLSKFGCLFERILFFNELTKTQVLNDFDLIVTSNPDIIINYNNNVVKYKTDYNEKINSPISISKLNELDDVISKY